MIREGFAQTIGEIVAYLVTLGGASGVVGRFIVDWRLRDLRRPSALRSSALLAERQHQQSWWLWIGTIVGAMGGLTVGLVSLAIDLAQR